MLRTIQPELLDSLPPQHPDALHSRRDLCVLNRLMGNHRWFARTLPALVFAGERVLEIGAGTGELGHRLARRHVAVDGLDLCPPPADWPRTRRWHTIDLHTFDGFTDYPAIIGNLVFHHFDHDELAALGAKLRRHARVVLACEPSRRIRSDFLFRRVSALLGLNRVTVHDARVSIAAGFLANELPDALGLDPIDWDISCRETLLGAYRMIATRRA